MKAVMYTNRREDRTLQFAEEFPDIDWDIVWSVPDFETSVADATLAILSNRICTPELGAALARGRTDSLRWIHFNSAGIERGVNMGLPRDVPVTTSAAAKAPVCAEHAVTLVLALSRRLFEAGVNKANHYWARREMNLTMKSAEGSKLLLIGLGGIGREIARKAKAFDMHVTAVTRGAPPSADIDRVVSREQLHAALPDADVVVIATASDPSSYQILGAAEFALMKPTAYVVNISRGELMDEAALIRALQAGEIAGAGIDVADPEPPDPTNPLWEMDNVIITPHVANAGSDNDYPRLKAVFEANLKRFRAGEPLANLYHFDVHRALPADA